MFKWGITLGILSSIVLNVLLNGAYVNAASDYDNSYAKTDTLTLTNNNFSNCPLDPLDVTFTWAQYISDENYLHDIIKSNPTFQQMRTSFANAQRWGVTEYGGNVLVYWTEDTSLSLNWTTNSVSVVSNTQNLHEATISNSCGWYGGDGGNAKYTAVNYRKGNISSIVSNQSINAQNLFVYTDHYNYPAGYEGEQIRDSYLGDSPDYNAGTGLIPISDYTVNNLDIVIKDVTNQSEKELYKIDECFFQLPNNSYGDNFTEYMYDCDNPQDIEHTFSEGYASYNIIHRLHSTETDLWYESTLVIDVDGSTFSGSIGKIEEDIYAKCINGDAPFLHFEQCLRAFGKIVNTLSFGVIQPLGAFKYDATTNCRQLGVLGDWINRPNEVVCPQFDENVRNIITPFISFALSLGVLGAILIKSDKEYV